MLNYFDVDGRVFPADVNQMFLVVVVGQRLQVLDLWYRLVLGPDHEPRCEQEVTFKPTHSNSSLLFFLLFFFSFFFSS